MVPISIFFKYTYPFSFFILICNLYQDELVAAHSVAFNLDGSKIFSGFNKMIRIFDSSRPGKDCAEYETVGKYGYLCICGNIR